MRVQDIMTTGVVTTTPDTSAEAAWSLMRQKNIQHLVVQDKGRLVGLVSAADTGGPRGVALRRNRVVGDLMTPHVVTTPASTTIKKAANVMRGRSIGSLVVVDSGRPVGIITVSDLLTLIGQGATRNAVRATRPTLSHRVPHRKRHTSAAAW
jgi:CBS domain-containing protein